MVTDDDCHSRIALPPYFDRGDGFQGPGLGKAFRMTSDGLAGEGNIGHQAVNLGRGPAQGGIIGPVIFTR